jgi:hypothetical protein
MLDSNATGFDKEANRTSLQHRIVSAEANAQISQHSLIELLLGEETLTSISSQLSYIAEQVHQRFAQAAARFKGQKNNEYSVDPWVGTGGASVCCGRPRRHQLCLPQHGGRYWCLGE